MHAQGTVGLELVQQVRELCSGSDLDAIIVPVGGGGLLAGIAVAARALCPGIRIIGAEPTAADDAWRSKQAGRLLEHDTLPDTLADGLRTVLGSKTWPIVRDQVQATISVF
jgi:threonine dehydratase